MTSYETSGQLRYAIAKGRHRCGSEWWIQLGECWVGQALRLLNEDGEQIARLDNDGRLYALRGYLWDGSSGPTIDGAADPVPSLVHDILYEAMRSRKLPKSMRGKADALYYDLLRERGMSRTRAGLRWLGLRVVGSWSASPLKGPEYPKRSAA